MKQLYKEYNCPSVNNSSRNIKRYSGGWKTGAIFFVVLAGFSFLIGCSATISTHDGAAALISAALISGAFLTIALVFAVLHYLAGIRDALQNLNLPTLQ